MEIIDAHCHLDFEAFDTDRSAVMSRASEAGIEKIVVPGVSAENWPRIHALCSQDSRLHACYGLHPYLTEKHSDQDIDTLSNWLDSHESVAIGECGLDYRKGQSPKQKQLHFFEAQLRIATDCDLPVVIHSVKATEDVIQTVRKFNSIRGMVHSYSGSYEQALQLIDLGFYISISGQITYDKARKLRATASDIPLESMLLETDAPDQPDAEHVKQRNEPAYIVNVLDTLVDLRDETKEEIAKQTTANAKALFKI
jgi:TatD DNase family protein